MSIFREILDKESSPALGCTEPMMFALGGAITRKYAPGKILRVDMEGCGLMVTGVQAVGIPKTGGKTGAFLSAAVGIVNGDADACKEYDISYEVHRAWQERIWSSGTGGADGDEFYSVSLRESEHF